MLTEESYNDVKSAVKKAGQLSESARTARCGEFDDAYYSGYRDQYYYYYYGDDSMDDFDDDDDDTVPTTSTTTSGGSTDTGSYIEPVDDDDDDDDGDDDFEYKHSQFHLGYRNELSKKVKDSKKGHGAIPIAAYASILAISVLLVSVVVIYVRWNKARAMIVMASRAHSGATKFSRLPTNDDQGSFRDMLREDDSSYGSL
jgi:hypothetical protein